MSKSAERNLFIIKALHTAIWLVLGSTVMYVLWSGVSGRVTVYSWWAVVAIVVEGVVLLLFRGRCPLTVIARRYSDSAKDNFDIFLPNRLARYNKLIFTSLFLIGLVLMALRYFWG